MIYWKGITHQLINVLVLADDNVALYTGGTVVPSVALNNNTLQTGGGVVDKKNDGRFNYTMSPYDCDGHSVGIVFSEESSQYKEHYFRPIEPPVQDDFYGAGAVLDTQKTALGRLDWNQHGGSWTRNNVARHTYESGGKKYITVNLNSPNVFALQTQFTLPDEDFIRMGVILRQGATGADGIYCFVDSGEDGESDPSLCIIQADDGDTLVSQTSLNPDIRGQQCVVRGLAIGAGIQAHMYANWGAGPQLASLGVNTVSHLNQTNHGLFLDRYDSSTTTLDFHNIKLVPYLEG